MEKDKTQSVFENIENSHLPNTASVLEDSKFGSDTVPDRNHGIKLTLDWPYSQSKASVSTTQPSQLHSLDDRKRQEKSEEVWRSVNSKGIKNIPNNVSKTHQPCANESVNRGSNLLGSYCTLADSNSVETTRKDNCNQAIALRLCDPQEINRCDKLEHKETTEDQHAIKKERNPDLDLINVGGTLCAVDLATKDQEVTRAAHAGEYCLASPINDFGYGHVIQSRDVERTSSINNVHTPCRTSTVSDRSSATSSERRVLGRNTPVVYANLPNALFNTSDQVHWTSSFYPQHNNCHANCISREVNLPQNVGISYCLVKHEDFPQRRPVIQQTQAECSSCSCLGSLKSKKETHSGNKLNKEPGISNDTHTTAEMDNSNSSAPSGRHYYNSGSALLKPLMKRMSMLTKAGAFRNWASTSAKTSKIDNSKTESKTSDRDLDRTSALGDDDGNSTVVGLDLSLPPRFSQIDSCPRQPLPRLPPPNPQGSQNHPRHHDHSFECLQQQNGQQQYHQSRFVNQQPERELFINFHQPQQERYVLHQSCSGFSLGHPLHSPHFLQHQQTHHPIYHHHPPQQQQQYQQQQQQQQQLQRLQQQHHQLARPSSTESLSSLLQTVRCGQNRYRISPVSILWTFLSVLLASACALSLATPCWMVHPDHIHSFGLFNVCIRDRRFALPRPLCMTYSDMKLWGVALPSALPPSLVSSKSSFISYPPSGASSSRGGYHPDIPPSSAATGGGPRQRRSARYSAGNKFRSSQDFSSFGTKNNLSLANNGLMRNTAERPHPFNLNGEILPFKQYYGANNNKGNNTNRKLKTKSTEAGNESNNGSQTGSRRAQSAAQISIPSTQRDTYRGRTAEASGLFSIPSVAWQAACLLFGAGVCVQVLGAMVSIAILVVTDPLHRRLATANGFLQTAGGE